MGLKKEIWRDIPNYEGYYQVSNLGRVRSVDRYVSGVNDSKRFLKGKIKPLQKHKDGYYQLRLHKNGIGKTYKNYQLVAYAFLNYKPTKGLVVDHIDNNGYNNKLSNLQIIKHKQNTRKDKECLGVSFHKASAKWRRYEYVNNKQVSLGYFNSKKEAINYDRR